MWKIVLQDRPIVALAEVNCSLCPFLFLYNLWCIENQSRHSITTYCVYYYCVYWLSMHHFFWLPSYQIFYRAVLSCRLSDQILQMKFWAHTLALYFNVRFIPQRQFCLLTKCFELDILFWLRANILWSTNLSYFPNSRNWHLCTSLDCLILW